MLHDRVAGNVRKSWALVGIFILLAAAIGWVFGKFTGFGIWGLPAAVGTVASGPQPGPSGL